MVEVEQESQLGRNEFSPGSRDKEVSPYYNDSGCTTALPTGLWGARREICPMVSAPENPDSTGHYAAVVEDFDEILLEPLNASCAVLLLHSCRSFLTTILFLFCHWIVVP
eukprot:scaffold20312_cov185-Amphora_coffeaeformis.AAC.2